MLVGRGFGSLSGFGYLLFLVGGDLGRVVAGNEHRCPWLSFLVPSSSGEHCFSVVIEACLRSDGCGNSYFGCEIVEFEA